MPTINVDALDARELQAIADILAGSKKVIVVTGAGISTSCGIPVRTATSQSKHSYVNYSLRISDPKTGSTA